MPPIISIFIVLILLFAPILPPDPIMSVKWDNDAHTSATVTWTQPEANVRTCLIRYFGAEYPSGICWEDLPEGEFSVTLPGNYTPVEAYQPKEGDRYEIWRNSRMEEFVYLGDFKPRRTYLPYIKDQAIVVYKTFLSPIRS